jgi:hypothetical protein
MNSEVLTTTWFAIISLKAFKSKPFFEKIKLAKSFQSEQVLINSTKDEETKTAGSTSRLSNKIKESITSAAAAKNSILKPIAGDQSIDIKGGETPGSKFLKLQKKREKSEVVSAINHEETKEEK